MCGLKALFFEGIVPSPTNAGYRVTPTQQELFSWSLRPHIFFQTLFNCQERQKIRYNLYDVLKTNNQTLIFKQ